MEELYKGYQIRADQFYDAWRLWVNPIHPHLPILNILSSFAMGPSTKSFVMPALASMYYWQVVPNVGLAALLAA
jgi:hypothetical protein